MNDDFKKTIAIIAFSIFWSVLISILVSYFLFGKSSMQGIYEAPGEGNPNEVVEIESNLKEGAIEPEKAPALEVEAPVELKEDSITVPPVSEDVELSEETSAEESTLENESKSTESESVSNIEINETAPEVITN